MVLRNLRLLAFLAAGALLGTIGFALAQGSYQIVSPSGSEQVQVNNPASAVNNFVLLNTIRNTTGYQLSSSTTGTIAINANVDNLILTGAVTTATVDLPASPPDASIVSINNGHGTVFSGTITVASTDSSTIVGSVSLTNLAASSGAEYQYVASSTTWYRLR
jgi:hypothetical protein